MAGHPTVMTPEVLKLLDEAFALGCTDLEATLYADISPATLYNYQAKNPQYLERKEQLKQRPFLKARNAVINAFSRDPNLALKYLERKKKDEFALRSELTGKDGEKLEGLVIVKDADNSPEQVAD